MPACKTFETLKYSTVALLHFLILMMISGCHSLQWHEQSRPTDSAPESIRATFNAQPDGVLIINASDPGLEYKFDPSEKDKVYGGSERAFRFRRVEVSLHEPMPQGMVMANFSFVDGDGNRINVGPVDLLRLTPLLDTQGGLQYAELLLEEYERFGISFRREHGEFAVSIGQGADNGVRKAADSVYRVGIWNNCLDPTKWEMIAYTEDYSDYAERRASDINLNQQRTLAHNWFFMHPGLYAELVRLKNPRLSIDPSLSYNELSDRGEKVVVDFAQFRAIKHAEPTETLEIGHKSGRKLVAVDSEQHYKWEYGLFQNKAEFTSYKDLVQKPVVLASFQECGFYQPDAPKQFDYGWLAAVDTISMSVIDQDSSDCFVEFALSGNDSPYKISLGNVDLASIDEQKLLGLPFGINPYPKTRRHNPQQDTLQYDTDRMPVEIKPYLLITRGDDGRWVNNQNLGIEKVFIGWQDLERNVLEIYLVSYERITAVWMAVVKVRDGMVDRIRVRRKLFTY